MTRKNNILLIALCSIISAFPLIATQALTPAPSHFATMQPQALPQDMIPSPAEIKRQKRLLAAQAKEQATRLYDRARAQLASLAEVIKNPKIITNAQKRQKITAWILAITEHMFTITEKLRNQQAPSPASLKAAVARLSLYVEALYDALSKNFPDELMAAPSIHKDRVKSKAKMASESVEGRLMQELRQQRAQLPLEQQKMIPEKLDHELVDILLVEQFSVAINQGLDNLATVIQDYGITTINRLARKVDWAAKRVTHNNYTPYLSTLALAAGASLVLGTLLRMPSPHYNGFTDGPDGQKLAARPGDPYFAPMLFELITGGIAAGISQCGGSLFTRGWESLKQHMGEINNRWMIWWKKCQGLPVKEKVNGFELITPEELDQLEDVPPIGLEEPLERVMSSITSAIQRMQSGEREPLKGIQRTYILVAKAGMGKTFLMELIKRNIAQLNQFGVTIAFESLQGEKVVFGDIMARIKEAQAQGIGLVLWIDEIHLYKPMKDGNQPLLAQLLQTEAINKSNIPVWIFAATNEPGRFDKALVRAGRFDIIEIHAPTFKARVRLFDYYLRQQGVVLPANDLKLLAAQTAQATPAMIRKVINAARASGQALTKQLILREILKSIFKLTSGFEALNERERREIAYYYTGKLLLNVLGALEQDPEAEKAFMQGDRFALATVAAVEKDMVELSSFVVESVANNKNFESDRRSFGAMFTYTGREAGQDMRMSLSEKQLKVVELLAGACTQEEFLKDVVDEMRKEDSATAFSYCLDIVCDGIPFDRMSKDDEQAYRKKALELFTASKLRAQTLIKKHKNICKIMSDLLLQEQEYPHLTARDVLALLKKESIGEQATAPQPTQEQATEKEALQPVTL
jgi:hypothetical protein